MEHYPPYLSQILKKNPKKKKQIIDFINRFTLVDDVIIDKEIFNYTFRCMFPGCGLCCFAGTTITSNEIKRVKPIIDELKSYLSISKVKRLDKLENSFYTRHRGTRYKLRTWDSSCIFLMEDKRCAVHAYCLDNKINWIKFHFDLCVTYPLSINQTDRIIQIEEELYNGEYVYPCFNQKQGDDINRDIDIVYYMKDVIIDRFGQSLWESLEKKYKNL